MGALLELAVVIPTFNERANVPVLIAKLDQALAGRAWEAIFVDDNSPDGYDSANDDDSEAHEDWFKHVTIYLRKMMRM